MAVCLLPPHGLVLVFKVQEDQLIIERKKEVNEMFAKANREEELVKCVCDDSVFYVPREVFSLVLLKSQRYSPKKYVRYKEGAKLYSISERKFYDLARNADAVKHIDKVALVCLEDIDNYIRLNNE